MPCLDGVIEFRKKKVRELKSQAKLLLLAALLLLIQPMSASSLVTYFATVIIEPHTPNTQSLRATGGYMLIGDGTPNWGSPIGTISFWIKWNAVANRPWGQHDNMETRFFGTNLVLDWGATGSLTSGTSFLADKWYFIAIVWNQFTDRLYLYVGDQVISPALDSANNAWASSVSMIGVTQNNFLASKGGVNPTNGYGDDLRYWNTDRTLGAIQGDYKIEISGSESNLRSYFKLDNNFVDAGPSHNDGSGVASYSFSIDAPFNP